MTSGIQHIAFLCNARHRLHCTNLIDLCYVYVQYLNELLSISHVGNNEQTQLRDMAVKEHQFLRCLYIVYVLRISIVS